LRRALRVAAVALLLLLAAGVATYVAGEQTEVVVLRSFDAQGQAHETKLWAVEHDGSVFVRVANPRRHWYRRLLVEPHAELVRGGRTTPVRAEPGESPELRAAIDARFREKYGAIDWWYGVLLRRNPLPVRLRAADAP
jgi:hypothetical protein